MLEVQSREARRVGRGAAQYIRDRPAEALVEEFHRLTRLAFLLSGDQSRSEDAAAEAIARVWQRSATVEIEERRAYLRRTVVNLVSRNRRRFWVEQEAAENAQQVDVCLVDATVADRIDIGQALLLLPIDQRAVIALRYFEDLSEGAIASILRIRPGTVKSRASRGLATMRGYLEGVDHV